MTANDDMSDLKALWRDAPGEEADGMTDMLVAKVQSMHRRSVLAAVAEIALTVGLVVALLYLAMTAGSPGFAVVLVLAALAVIGYQGVIIAWRRQLWRATLDTVSGHAEVLAGHARLKLRLARLCYITGPLGILLGFGIARFGFGSPIDFPRDAIAVAVPGAILIATGLWQARRARRALAEASRLSDALGEETR